MSDQLEPQEGSPAQGGDAPITPEKKKSLIARLKNLTRFRIRLQVVDRRGENAAPEEGADASGGDEPGKKKRKEKMAKPVKVKRDKPKKPRALKLKKLAKIKDGESEKKRPLLPILIAAGILVLGGGGFGIFTLVNTGNDPEARLLKAEKLTAEAKYTDAMDVYNKLIAEQLVLPEAYLGLADTFLAAADRAGAIAKLQAGYSETGDERVRQRLEELSPPAEPVPDPAEPGAAVIWQDPALEKMIRLALGIPEGQEIRPGDLESIRSLKILGATHAVANGTIAAFNTPDGYIVDGVDYTERGGITSLADLRHCRNLTKLIVAYNHVRGLDGLSGLQRLETLGLYANDITEIGGLSALENLQYLYLYGNNITDISPLSKLSKLHDLWLQHNQIADISPLAGLQGLSELLVSHNQVEKIDVLRELPNLHFFYADYNKISNVGPAAEAKALTDVSFVGNPVTDLTLLRHIQNINKPYGRTAI